MTKGALYIKLHINRRPYIEKNIYISDFIQDGERTPGVLVSANNIITSRDIKPDRSFWEFNGEREEHGRTNWRFSHISEEIKTDLSVSLAGWSRNSFEYFGTSVK